LFCQVRFPTCHRRSIAFLHSKATANFTEYELVRGGHAPCGCTPPARISLPLLWKATQSQSRSRVIKGGALSLSGRNQVWSGLGFRKALVAPRTRKSTMRLKRGTMYSILRN
jgi:hypothetical protein